MAQGRGSANRFMVVGLMIALLCFIILSDVAESATTYTVGDSTGWTFNTNSWPSGKRFRAGDVLVFKYNARAHDLVAVNAAGYKSCSIPRGSRKYTSGRDSIKLSRGTNYFICSYPGHCQSGMKLAITAV